MSDQAKQSAVKVRLARYQEDMAVKKVQSEAAAKAVSLYTEVLEGLDGIVPADRKYMVATTLTAGIYAAPD